MDSVIFLAKGHSELEYRNNKERPNAEELWVVNSLGYHYPEADKIFRMDDLRRFPPQSHQEEYLKNVCSCPIITSRAYPEYPTSCEYPLQDVLSRIEGETLTKKLFACTVVYALLYAEMLGVKKIKCWGVDLGESPPELSLATAYTVGRLVGKGIDITLSEGSKLNNMTILSDCKQYYGYYKEN